MIRAPHVGACLLLLLLGSAPELALAGVTNPKISVIGQPFVGWTNDESNPDRERARLDPGETEIVYDDYLNPYARAYFTVALHDGGVHLEEGYFDLLRGLPLDLALRGGQVRVPFGRLNQFHPHTYPFAERFGLLETYLPGDELFGETAIELSRRFATFGETSILAEAAWLQGDSFRIEEHEEEGSGHDHDHAGEDASRPGALARLSGFGMLGERSALELGASFAYGTNDVEARTRTTLFGLDAKAKLWTSDRAYLVLQGEGIWLDLERPVHEDPVAAEDDHGTESIRPAGAYLFADYNWNLRYNAGLSYERYQEPLHGKPWTQSIGAFAGLALLEESTVFRLDWRRIDPEEGDAVDTVTLRAIFSLGPHKAHQF